MLCPPWRLRVPLSRDPLVAASLGTRCHGRRVVCALVLPQPAVLQLPAGERPLAGGRTGEASWKAGAGASWKAGGAGEGAERQGAAVMTFDGPLLRRNI